MNKLMIMNKFMIMLYLVKFIKYLIKNKAAS